MRKIALAAATVAVFAAGGMAANAQYRGEVYEEPGMYVEVPPGAVVYDRYDGRSYYVAPDQGAGFNPRNEPNHTDPWYMPGDQAIINQQRQNDRSTRNNQ